MRACFDAISKNRWARPQSHVQELEHAGLSAANSSGDLERVREPTYMLTALVFRVLGALRCTEDDDGCHRITTLVFARGARGDGGGWLRSLDTSD